MHKECPSTANDRLKDAWSSRFWTSLIVAVVVHFSVLQFSPTLMAEDVWSSADGVESMIVPPVTELPPAPEKLARPAIPVVSTDVIADDVTIPSTRFDDHPPERLAPPSSAREGETMGQPAFVPYEVAPRILNPRDVEDALRREYPAVMRDAGIQGTVRVWFRIDAEGRVVDRRIQESSGYRQLDEAALEVADLMEFSPAMNRDRPVAVGVTFGIRFEVR